jgi:Lon protease-like protein
MTTVSERFPLFPLGLVMLPGEVVPLHIFEPRYRLMIGECLESETGFGVVWSGEDGVRDVGCGAEVTKVLERLEDGRMNILSQGTQPFRLSRRIGDMPYPAGDVEWLDDDPPNDDPPGAGPEAADAARNAYADLVERVTETRPEGADLDEMSAYDMAATIAFDAPEKQELLELRDEDARMRRLAALCSGALERMTKSREAAARASSNGKVHY